MIKYLKWVALAFVVLFAIKQPGATVDLLRGIGDGLVSVVGSLSKFVAAL